MLADYLLEAISMNLHLFPLRKKSSNGLITTFKFDSIPLHKKQLSTLVNLEKVEHPRESGERLAVLHLLRASTRG